jgi:hypothetical protein
MTRRAPPGFKGAGGAVVEPFAAEVGASGLPFVEVDGVELST